MVQGSRPTLFLSCPFFFPSVFHLLCGGKSLCSIVRGSGGLRSFIWKAPAVSLVFPAFDDRAPWVILRVEGVIPVISTLLPDCLPFPWGGLRRLS